MILFVLFLIFILATAVCVGGAVFGNRRDRGPWAGGAAFCFVVGIILLFFSITVSVGTKNVGVKLTFGKPSGFIQNGLHFKAPWQTVTELNDAIQTDTYASDYTGPTPVLQQGAVATCINVRIERQATACVNVSIRWQIKPSGVDYLFRNFKGNEAITDNLVLRDLQSAMNENLSHYDPLGIDTNGNSTNEPLNAPNNGQSVSRDVTQEMQHQLDAWINVQSVFIPLLNFDTSTQARINQVQQQIASTRIAQQQLLTNKAQAAANKALAQSVANTPGVLTDKCLNIQKEAVDKGQSLAGAPSCFSNTSSQAIVSK
jgi:regulator of protease activity HflC (stomatin/prohibitin superfamily)